MYITHIWRPVQARGQVALLHPIPRFARKLPNVTPNLPTNILDFRGFDSSIILI